MYLIIENGYLIGAKENEEDAESICAKAAGIDDGSYYEDEDELSYEEQKFIDDYYGDDCYVESVEEEELLADDDEDDLRNIYEENGIKYKSKYITTRGDAISVEDILCELD